MRKMGYEHVFFVDDFDTAADLLKRLETDLVIYKLNPEYSLGTLKALFQKNKTPVLYIADSGKEILTYEALPNLLILLRKPLNTLTFRSAIEIYFKSLEETRKKYLINFKKDFDNLELDISRINWIRIDGNYSFIHTQDENHTLRMSMKEIMNLLPEELFVRVHRSYAIRIKKINSINLKEKTVNIDGKLIPLGRKYKKDLMERLKII